MICSAVLSVDGRDLAVLVDHGGVVLEDLVDFEVHA